jgi:uncharacterized paraquat-inducible protein A
VGWERDSLKERILTQCRSRFPKLENNSRMAADLTPKAKPDVQMAMDLAACDAMHPKSELDVQVAMDLAAFDVMNNSRVHKVADDARGRSTYKFPPGLVEVPGLEQKKTKCNRSCGKCDSVFVPEYVKGSTCPRCGSEGCVDTDQKPTGNPFRGVGKVTRESELER